MNGLTIADYQVMLDAYARACGTEGMRWDVAVAAIAQEREESAALREKLRELEPRELRDGDEYAYRAESRIRKGNPLHLSDLQYQDIDRVIRVPLRRGDSAADWSASQLLRDGGTRMFKGRLWHVPIPSAAAPPADVKDGDFVFASEAERQAHLSDVREAHDFMRKRGGLDETMRGLPAPPQQPEKARPGFVDLDDAEAGDVISEAFRSRCRALSPEVQRAEILAQQDRMRADRQPEKDDPDVAQFRFIEALGADGEASVEALSSKMSLRRTAMDRRMAVEIARRRLAEIDAEKQPQQPETLHVKANTPYVLTTEPQPPEKARAFAVGDRVRVLPREFNRETGAVTALNTAAKYPYEVTLDGGTRPFGFYGEELEPLPAEPAERELWPIGTEVVVCEDHTRFPGGRGVIVGSVSDCDLVDVKMNAIGVVALLNVHDLKLYEPSSAEPAEKDESHGTFAPLTAHLMAALTEIMNESADLWSVRRAARALIGGGA